MSKKKKILFTANLDSFIIKFLIPQLKYFKENNYEVSVASKSENIDIPYCDIKYDVDFARGFNLKQNINSYKEMKKILKENHYDIISCHTPFGGAIPRLALKNLKIKDTKIVYMAHGFHFFKNGPLLNWLIFYPVEKYLAKFTDSIITINLDDYELAKKKFKSKIYYVPGIGLDPKRFEIKFTEKDKKDLRNSLGLNEKDFVMIYVAEINKNKRQLWLTETVKDLLANNKNMHLLLVGKDWLNNKCQNYVKKIGLDKQIHFLGFRKDVPELFAISNVSLTSSLREGLPVNVMEAIYMGLPVVATSCRGNRDLISNNINGFVVDINDKKEFCNKILEVYKLSKKERDNIKKVDKEIIEKYLLDNVLNDIIDVYLED